MFLPFLGQGNMNNVLDISAYQRFQANWPIVLRRSRHKSPALFSSLLIPELICQVSLLEEKEAPLKFGQLIPDPNVPR